MESESEGARKRAKEKLRMKREIKIFIFEIYKIVMKLSLCVKLIFF